MKITKLEAGVYLIEKSSRCFKLSKMSKGWVLLSSEGSIIMAFKSKKEALLIIEKANF